MVTKMIVSEIRIDKYGEEGRITYGVSVRSGHDWCELAYGVDHSDAVKLAEGVREAINKAFAWEAFDVRITGRLLP